jgi:hypothetical protein
VNATASAQGDALPCGELAFDNPPAGLVNGAVAAAREFT